MVLTYFIGGSPCGGKSTVAEILSKRYGFYYFKVDDFLPRYVKMGAAKGYPVCKKQLEMSAEQIWMREPLLQCREELEFYEEVWEFVWEDLKQVEAVNGIITEGAAYLPKLMKRLGVPANRYIAITPTEDFQIFHFRKREFVPYVLAGCSSKEKAFGNWMKRDVLFAKEVQRQCGDEKYALIINDGSMEVDALVGKVTAHFDRGDDHGGSGGKMDASAEGLQKLLRG